MIQTEGMWLGPSSRDPEPAASTTPVRGLPARVSEARQARGLSVEALAWQADVPSAVVEAMEAGSPVTEESRDAVHQVLGLTVRPAHAMTRPESPGHAAMLIRLRDQAARLGGTGVAPDLLAWKRDVGWSDGGEKAANAAARRARDWGVQCFNVLGVSALAAFVAWLTGLTSASTLGVWWGAVANLTLGFLLLGSAAGLAASLLAEARAKAETARLEDLQRALDGMTNKGFIVSRSGLSVVDLKWSDPSVATHPAKTVYSVDVTSHGASHVTVSVGTTKAVVTLPWLPRSQALLDLVRSWAAPSDDLPWTPTSTTS